MSVLMYNYRINAMGNILIKYFKNCTTGVKLELFRTYYSCLYSSQLWCDYSAQAYRRIRVALNDIFRALMHIKRGESISQFYVFHNITDFNSLIRKTVYGFYQRLMNSKNVLIETIISSVYFTYGSKLLAKWTKLLLVSRE